MLKSSLLFAGAGLAIVMLAPGLMPALDRIASSSAVPPRQAAAVEPAPTSVAIAPAPALTASAGNDGPDPALNPEIEIAENEHNQYFVDALVEGRTVRFLVDTGANFVSINAQTAKDLGYQDFPWSKHYVTMTANGQAKGFGVSLRQIEIGPISVADVDAIVQPSLGRMNLLGMNFLHRLTKFEQRDGRLVLRQ